MFVAAAVGTAISWVGAAATSALTSGLFAVGVGKASFAAASAIVGAAGSLAASAALSYAMTALMQPQVGAGGSPTAFKADPAAPISGVMGRFGVGGRQLHGNVWGKGNLYLSFATALSLGPISGVAEFKANDTVVTFPGPQGLAASVEPYKDKMWMTYRLGLPADTALQPPSGVPDGSPSMSEWTTSHKTPGLAASFWTLKNNSKRASYEGGVPRPLWTLLGMLVWDPRQDSTYPGGSGAQRRDDWTTWAYSENPHLHALAWARGHFKLNTDGSIDRTKRLAGVGAPDAAIDIASFVDGANISDANGWKISGEWTTSDDKWQVLAAMLQAGGAVPLNRGAMIGCMTEAPRASILTLTQEDIVGPVRIGVMASRRDRPNTIIPRYRSEPHKWEEVPAGAVSAATYVTEDRGEPRSREVSYRYVGGGNAAAKQAAELAAYDLANARETLRPSIPAKPYMLGLRAGDAFTIEAPETGMNGQKVVLMRRPFDPASAIVTLECRSETDAKHAWALGQSASPPDSPSLTAVDPVPPAPEPDDWNVEVRPPEAGGGQQPGVIVSENGEVTVTDNVGRILIEVAPDSLGPWSQVYEGPPTTSAVPVNGLGSGATYYVGITYYSLRGAPSERLVKGPYTAPGLIADDTTPVVPATVAVAPTLSIATAIAPDGTQVSRLAAAWAAAADAVSYIVEIDDGVATWSEPSTEAALADRIVATGKTYRVRTKGVSRTGHLSADWSPWSLSVAAGGDTTAPGPITVPTVVPLARRNVLTWTNPTDADFSHIILYRNTSGTSPETTGEAPYAPRVNGSIFPDTNVSAGVTYYYWSRTVDRTGNVGALTYHGAAAPFYIRIDKGDVEANDPGLVTQYGVSAGFLGQTDWATSPLPTSRLSYLDDTGNLSGLDRVSNRALSLLTGRTANYLTYTSGGATVDSLKPGEPGANVTESRTAAAISGQGALATKNTANFDTDVAEGTTYKKFLSTERSKLTGVEAGATVGGIFGTNLLEAGGGSLATLGNFKTALGTAAAISGQGSLATRNDVAWGTHLTGRPAELTDGRVSTGLNSSGYLISGLNAHFTPSQMMNGVSGTQLSRDPEFTAGIPSNLPVYDNSSSGKTTRTREADATAPNASGFVLKVSYDGTGTPDSSPQPGYGGVVQILEPAADGTPSRPGRYAKNTKLLYRIWAKIPVGRSLYLAHNAFGTGGTATWLTSQAGTGDWALYEVVYQIGSSGSFGSIGHIYINGGTNTAFDWYIAKYEQVDITSAQSSFLTDLRQVSNGARLGDAPLITAQGTAAAFTGQGALATKNTAAWGSDISGRPGALTDLVDLNGIPRLNANYITTSDASKKLQDYFPEDVNSNRTENRTAAGFLNQGALATKNAAVWGSDISGRPTELTDGRIAAGLTSVGRAVAVDVPDVRSTNETPAQYRARGKGVWQEFKQRTAIGAPGSATYVQLETVVPYQDQSGGVIVQTVRSNDGVYQRRSLTSNDAGGWGSWVKVYDQLNKPVFGSDLLESNGSTVATDANYKTGLGTAAGFSGQGALATLNTVGEAQIGTGAVSATKIADGVVSGAKLATGAVDLASTKVTGKSLANVDATANTKLSGIASGATVGARAGTNLYRTDGATVMSQAEVRTPEGTAAAIVGQAPTATDSSFGALTSVPERLGPHPDHGATYLNASYIAYSAASGSNTVQALRPQEAGANVTESRTAAAYTGQTEWGTYSGRPAAALTSAIDTSGYLVSGLNAHFTTAQMMNGAAGTQLSKDPEWTTGIPDNLGVYDNSGGGKTTITHWYDAAAPNASSYILKVSYDGTGTPGSNPSPGWGGVYQGLNYAGDGNPSRPGYYAKNTKVLYRIWAHIPVGRNLQHTSNSYGDQGTSTWLTSNAGTGDWALYEILYHIGWSGTFSSIGHIYVSDGPNTAFDWYIAKYEQVDITSAQASFLTDLRQVSNGARLGDAPLITAQGTAAAILGQAPTATDSSFGALTAVPARLGASPDYGSTYLDAYAVAFRASQGGATIGDLRPAEYGSNITENRTAAAVAGQGNLVTTTIPEYADVATARANGLVAGQVFKNTATGKPEAVPEASATTAIVKQFTSGAGAASVQSSTHSTSVSNYLELGFTYDGGSLNADATWYGTATLEEYNAGSGWRTVGSYSFSVSSTGLDLGGGVYQASGGGGSISGNGVRTGTVTYRVTVTRDSGPTYVAGAVIDCTLKITPIN